VLIGVSADGYPFLRKGILTIHRAELKEPDERNENKKTDDAPEGNEGMLLNLHRDE
jgi:hypothetical protein